MNILGHTSVSTTQIYQDVMGETLVKDLLKVNSSLLNIMTIFANTFLMVK